MSGPLPAPPSVATADGKRLVVSGVGALGDMLISDGAGRAHWGPPGLPAGLISPATESFWFTADTSASADGAVITPWSNRVTPFQVMDATYGNLIKRAYGGPGGGPWADDSASGRLTNAIATPLGSFTQFMVIKPGPVLALPQCVLGGSVGTAMFMGLQINNTVFVMAEVNDVVGASVAQLPANTWSFVSVRLDAATGPNTFSVRVNNISRTVVMGGGARVFSADVENIAASRHPAYFNAFNGGLAEFGGWNSALTDAQLDSLQRGISSKYGI